MFRSYDLTTYLLFYNIDNIIVIGLITRCLVAIVMGDVFALVYNFHMPLSLKVKTVCLMELVAIYFRSLSFCVFDIKSPITWNFKIIRSADNHQAVSCARNLQWCIKSKSLISLFKTTFRRLEPSSGKSAYFFGPYLHQVSGDWDQLCRRFYNLQIFLHIISAGAENCQGVLIAQSVEWRSTIPAV
jgi:hypothetical protein